MFLKEIKIGRFFIKFKIRVRGSKIVFYDLKIVKFDTRIYRIHVVQFRSNNFI